MICNSCRLASTHARKASSFTISRPRRARWSINSWLPASQVFIEIRQDTKGVLGLHALRRGDAGVDTLELIYQ